MAGLFSSCITFSSKEIKEYTKEKHTTTTTTTEMVISCVEDALAHLSSVLTRVPYLPDSINVQVKDFQLQFRFLKLFLWIFPQWDCHQNLHFSFSFIFTTIEDMCKYVGPDFYAEWIIAAIGHENWTEWIGAKVKDKIHECKAEIKKYSNHLISCSLKSDPFTRNETLKFLDFLHANMNDLVDEFAPSKTQINMLEERLIILRDLIFFTPMTMSGEENFDREKVQDFEFYVYDWANKAARLTILHWLIEEQDEETGEKLQGLHLHLVQKTPEFIRLCFGVIKYPNLRRVDTLIFGEFVSRFVDFFLENMVFTLKDDVPMLREGLIFLITFLADPPNNMIITHYELSFIQKKIDAVLDQASHTICLFGETSMDLATGKITAVDFQKSVDEVRGEIERLYVWIPHSSWSNFPRTNGLGYFESLVVYLEVLKDTMNKNKKLVPFLKHQIVTIKEELMLLRPLLPDIRKMQNEHKGVKDLWDQIISLSYQADLAIKSSFFIDHPIWYNLTYLSFVVGKIKDIQSKVMRIKDNYIFRSEAVTPLTSSVDVFKSPTSTSIVEVVVGFKHETEVLIDRLTSGTGHLDIVPIVGMGGIGKTTLAKKLFNEPSIIYHFHKRAFCSVSQEYRKKNVLLDILSDLRTIDDDIRQMSDDDLAHMLFKFLSGHKYLIVIDDIWDIDAWYDVRTSFPDNNNGSRVIFTTRINNISLIAKSDSIPHLLPFLSVDESWELLRQKIFRNDLCPPHLCKVGKLIAKKCQGLPLAIVVIAGVLARTERSSSHWNEVAYDFTFAFSEDCKDVIRLSYKQLPEALKSCFLYLAAFREDENIEAKMLSKLWVAEGFVLKSGSSHCLRKIAKQYLNELGDRNLVTVTHRSCNGWIKHFIVHDLVRDFCRTEAQEQHCLCFDNSHTSKLSMSRVWESSMSRVWDQYRVCIKDESISSNEKSIGPTTVHSLLHFVDAKRRGRECSKLSLESFLFNFKLVQVLDLRMVGIVGGFPTAATKLVHLRYLALQLVQFPTLNVPSEISNLWNLETLLLLRINRYRKVQFPNDIWKMKRLRHVEAGDEAHVALDDDVSGVSSQLPDLETFKSLVIAPGKDGEELLKRLPNLRKLSCRFNGCNQIPKLEILTNLESLQMGYIGERLFKREDCFFQGPCKFNFPLTIRKLTLELFELSWNEFSALIQKLPSLQVLQLYNIPLSFGHAKMWDLQDEEFRNVRSLTLFDSAIVEWKVSIDSFPNLEELHLLYCERLIEIPPCFGEVLTLKSIQVQHCNKGVVDSAIQIQKEQLDSGNQINLQVVT